MSLQFELRANPQPRTAAEREAILAAPGFGLSFTDHMAVATWTSTDGWHDSAVVPYGPFSLDPATAVLHYAQEIFEGLKAYRHADGSVWLFRPDQNAARMIRSAQRMALPVLPAEDFLASIDALVAADAAWVPSAAEQTLYLRPFMFASEAFLGVRPAQRVTYCCIASPAGPYFAGGVHPVSIWLSTTYTRAAPGGMGAAKTGGNYAASLVAQQEAAAHGCDQVMFADAVERAYVEELGGMNVYLVTSDGQLITPELTGSILEGVTRDSILTLASEFGLTPVERRVGIDELIEGIDSGWVAELFACGTAAVVTPIGVLRDTSGSHQVGSGETGETTAALRKDLLDVQYGRAEDRHGWLRRVL
ncbi:MAG: Branched-chain amino acid aminotransferase [uncultured Friedmanniella sp.]|uniref:Branched-chain-amino-acid aminotransferase n=1 Tax=uncultured Friedmanniella sp. TaxID=335381 RepID=A0A6J4KFD0_9ACTN|nr:branched-chain amino acid aminotransferase [uncultured Friedmanniella sp.]CAA9304245.1 MAG: Branched-chain amino acid aminotransferase [uncultured Friedmanniella sp.]